MRLQISRNLNGVWFPTILKTANDVNAANNVAFDVLADKSNKWGNKTDMCFTLTR